MGLDDAGVALAADDVVSRKEHAGDIAGSLRRANALNDEEKEGALREGPKVPEEAVALVRTQVLQAEGGE